MSETDYAAAKEVARANREFYRSFEAFDLEGMVEVWLDDARIRCVHPGWEMLHGPEPILASWRAIFLGTESIRFDLADLAIEIVGDTAVVTQVERIQMRTADSEDESEAAATNVFLRRDGEWKLLLHHSSPIAQRFFEAER